MLVTKGLSDCIYLFVHLFGYLCTVSTGCLKSCFQLYFFSKLGVLTIVPDICREWEASFKGFNPESNKNNLVEHLKESNGFSGLEINPCHILCLRVFVCVCLFIAISICPTSFLSVWAKFL